MSEAVLTKSSTLMCMSADLLWAVEAFRWSVQEKLVEGMGDDTLAPQAGASRAMIATVVMRYLSRFAA